MFFGFNWVDLVIILLLLYFAFEAFGRPFLLECLDLASFLLALIFSFRFYNYPAEFIKTEFNLPHGLSLVAGFMLAWFLTEIIFYLLSRLILPNIPRFRLKGSEYLSIFPAFFRGLVFVALILVLIAAFPVQPNLKRSINQSKIGSFILAGAYQLERPVKQIFGGVTQDSLTFLTIKPKTNERVNLGFQTSEFKVDGTTEFTMVDLVNKERTSRGLNTLEFDSKLRDVGRYHSADMFEGGYFAHYSPEGESVADRAEKAGVDYLVIGENLAYAPTLELAHKGLMNSEGHRANILSPDYNKLGVGVMDGGDYGKMFTQVFSN
ncbi:MAG: Uncharacterized protein CEO21_243 [Microgenomates group bacterium Gr01-1014_80]|nr:MAG: Uncharacterized protein CEO21_243 [Microgenomates group bacterium Gr01-1014_80]